MTSDSDHQGEYVTHADSPSLCLRVVAGGSVGTTWILTEPLTLIGRTIGCHIRIDDSHVSRLQCEIAVDSANVILRNLSERNPTFVNGLAREEAVLHVGDVISFAGCSLMVEHAHCEELQRQSGSLDSRTTRTFAEALYLRGDFIEQGGAGDARLAGDLQQLVALMRALSRAESLDTLVNRLTTNLKHRLNSENCWIGWRIRALDDMVLYPPTSPEHTRNAPFSVMREACVTAGGLMIPGLGVQSQSYVIAAPLVHGSECFGAVVLQRSGEHGNFEESDLEYLVAAAECCAPLIRAAERMEQLQRDAHNLNLFDAATAPMLGDSDAMRHLHAEIRRAAAAPANLIFQGETGVGKELAARMLHDLSPRADGPYIVVNCAAVAHELFESEMFGHERGAFTGALRRRKGFFELAQGGTLFLDEVAELSLPNQAHLLRAVETGTFRPVGSERELKVDVRVVCATNRFLPDKDQAYFRIDLYHRLAGIVIRIVPLREHREDIPALATHFLRLAATHAPARPDLFSPEALAKLLAYDWPGNVRELRNVVERAAYMATSNTITEREISLDSLGTTRPTNTPSTTLDELEKRHLLSVLLRNKGSVASAASELGLSRSALYYKLARHEINPRIFRE